MKTLCHDCKKRPVSAEQRGIGGSLCEQCADWASWENEHSDNCHDEINAGEEMSISDEHIAEIRETSMKNCPICLGLTHPSEIEVRKGHTNTQAKTYTSHADCNHPRTPKAREICRRARKAANIPAQPKGRRPTRGSMDSPVVAVDLERRARGSGILMSKREQRIAAQDRAREAAANAE